MIYKTSLDKTALAITLGVTILFAVIIGGQYVIIKDMENVTPIYTIVGLSLIYLLAFAFRPIDYVLTDDEVIIRRLFLNIRIKRAAIDNVKLINKSEISDAIRTFGVGGLFGYYGNFYNFSIGRMTWYVTRKDKPVMIKTIDQKTIILTPNDPESFVNQLNTNT